MQPPQLQQYEIRLQRAIGREVRPPVAVVVLAAEQVIRGAARGLRASGQNGVGDLKARTHTRAMVRSFTVRLSSDPLPGAR